MADPTLADAINHDIQEFTKMLDKSKAQVLPSIKTVDLTSRPCSEITSINFAGFARELSATPQSQMVGNYLAHLSSVVAMARPV